MARLDDLGGVQTQVLAVARADDLHAHRQAAGAAGRHRHGRQAEQVAGEVLSPPIFRRSAVLVSKPTWNGGSVETGPTTSG